MTIEFTNPRKVIKFASPDNGRILFKILLRDGTAGVGGVVNDEDVSVAGIVGVVNQQQFNIGIQTVVDNMQTGIENHETRIDALEAAGGGGDIDGGGAADF